MSNKYEFRNGLSFKEFIAKYYSELIFFRKFEVGKIKIERIHKCLFCNLKFIRGENEETHICSGISEM